MSAPTVSILTPLLNPDPGFLRATIQSVIGQTFDDFEYIIVEDPPRPELADVAPSVVADFADPRIRLVRNPQRTSQVQQRNRAIEEACGEFIAWIDADDICEPNRIEKQLAFLRANPDTTVVGCRLTIVDQDGEPTGARDYPTRHDEIAAMMPIRNPMSHPGIMAKAAAVRDVGGYHEEVHLGAEDYDLWCRMIAAGYRFANIEERLVRYRFHPAQIKSKGLRDQISATLDVKRKHFTGSGRLAVRSRIWMERALLHLPPKLVMWLFTKLYITKGTSGP